MDDYFAISKLLFSYSFNVPRITLYNVYFFIVGSMFLFLFNRSQPKASVVNQISHLFFLKLKNIFFYLFNFLKMVSHIHNVVSALINVVKLDIENNNTVSTLYNFVNNNVEIGNVDLTLFNVANLNIDRHNVLSTLIWHCPTSYHPNNHVETTLKGFLAIGEYYYIIL